jgi:orotate phosphoribosyltransferase-like protein
VPANIQDLIERNIRTLSNSMSSKSELERLNLKDMKEKWLTKKEMLMQSDRNKNDFINTSIDESVSINHIR